MLFKFSQREGFEGHEEEGKGRMERRVSGGEHAQEEGFAHG